MSVSRRDFIKGLLVTAVATPAVVNELSKPVVVDTWASLKAKMMTEHAINMEKMFLFGGARGGGKMFGMLPMVEKRFGVDVYISTKLTWV